MNKAHAGFTLIELMIVVAIIGILAAIALPQYQQYTKKAKFTEITIGTSAVKTAVEVCAQDLATTTGCTGGTNSVPANITVAVGRIATLATLNGVITATAVTTGGLNGETYVLTPTAGVSAVTWAVTGTCKTIAQPIC